MSLNLKKAIASGTASSRGGAAVRITRRKSGDLLKLSPEIIRRLEIGKEAFGKSGTGICVLFLEEQKSMIFAKDIGKGQQTLSGNVDSPAVYSSAIGRNVDRLIGKEIATNKTLAFTEVTYDVEDETQKPLAVVDLRVYNASQDAFVEKM